MLLRCINISDTRLPLRAHTFWSLKHWCANGKQCLLFLLTSHHFMQSFPEQDSPTGSRLTWAPLQPVQTEYWWGCRYCAPASPTVTGWEIPKNTRLPEMSQRAQHCIYSLEFALHLNFNTLFRCPPPASQATQRAFKHHSFISQGEPITAHPRDTFLGFSSFKPGVFLHFKWKSKVPSEHLKQ